MSNRELVIRIERDRDGNQIAVVENFPGLHAEMTERELEAMASQLNAAASKIRVARLRRERESGRLDLS